MNNTSIDAISSRLRQRAELRAHARRRSARAHRRGSWADAPFAPSAWLTIATDGAITIVSPAAEMGQGSFTTLPLIIAEELDADWSKVKPVLPPAWDDKNYGNPAYGGTFQTSASASVHGYFKALRIAGAQARRVLLDAVAAKWNVPVSELSTEPSVVVHKASNRRMSYGEIASFAKAPAELPKIEEKDLKPTASFRLIGKDVPRAELPIKVTGAAKYAQDVQVPGMVYAAVLQSPYFGGAPRDGRRHRGAQGRGHHRHGEAARRRRRHRHDASKRRRPPRRCSRSPGAMRRAPSTTASARSRSSPRSAATRAARACPMRKVGDAKAAMANAASVFRGEYRTRYVYHAQMEPLNATASVSPDGKSAEIWAGTQGASGLLNQVGGAPADRPLQAQAASAFARRRLRPPRAAGGDHGRDPPLQGGGQAGEARLEPRGRLTFGKFRPMTAHHIEAGFDDERQARRLASSHRLGIGRRLYGRDGRHPPGAGRPHRDEGIADPAISDSRTSSPSM